jgi:hypothetical protein
MNLFFTLYHFSALLFADTEQLRKRKLFVNDKVLFDYWRYNLCCKFPQNADHFKQLKYGLEGLRDGMATLALHHPTNSILNPYNIPSSILQSHWTQNCIGSMVTMNGDDFDRM